MTTLGRARRHIVAVAALLAFASSAPALAQTRLYLLTGGDQGEDCTPSCDPGRLIVVDADRGQVMASTPILHARSRGYGPAVTPDGQFLLWSGTEQLYDDWWGGLLEEPLFLAAYDLVHSGALAPLLSTEFALALPFAIAPDRMRAVVQYANSSLPPVVMEPGKSALLPAPCIGFLVSQSGDGRRLSFRCSSPIGTLVVDSTSGHVIGNVPADLPEHALDTTGDAILALVLEGSASTMRSVYVRFDVATGAVLAARAVPPLDGPLVLYDGARERVYAQSGAHLVVLDARTLLPIASIAAPFPDAQPSVVVDEDGSVAYVAWSSRTGPPAVHLSAVETASFSTLGSMPVAVDSRLRGLALAPRPPRVSGLQATVSQRAVTIGWTSTGRGLAVAQQLEVGFASGEAAFVFPLPPAATSLTVPGVPAGRYYVRIRSLNGTGVSPPSNEVVVDVP